MIRIIIIKSKSMMKRTTLAVSSILLYSFVEAGKMIEVPLTRRKTSAPKNRPSYRNTHFNNFNAEEIEIDNSYNIAYTGPVYFGTPL